MDEIRFLAIGRGRSLPLLRWCNDFILGVAPSIIAFSKASASGSSFSSSSSVSTPFLGGPGRVDHGLAIGLPFALSTTSPSFIIRGNFGVTSGKFGSKSVFEGAGRVLTLVVSRLSDEKVGNRQLAIRLGLAGEEVDPG